MCILTKSEIKKGIDEKHIVISPLLEETQIGEISVDFRVGMDFLTMHQGRDPFIDTSNNHISKRPIKSNFTETRRKIGEHFLIHPFQTILFSTLEYVKLPNNVYLSLNLRSSYSRLGLSVSTIVQPGYVGCISVEIVNSGNIPIKIVSGARFLQGRFLRLPNEMSYFETLRKYNCQVRPVASKANEDADLDLLERISKL